MRFTLKTKDGQIRTYWCSNAKHAYVYEEFEGKPGTLGRQVNDRLGYWGDMMLSTPETLADDIRAARRRELAHKRRIEHDGY